MAMNSRHSTVFLYAQLCRVVRDGFSQVAAAHPCDEQAVYWVYKRWTMHTGKGEGPWQN